MGKKQTALKRRAWNLVRMALLWARKGGIFKRRFMVDGAPSYTKRIRAGGHDSIWYQEREFSFDETPIIQFKLHKPSSGSFRHLIPCMNPPVDFDYNDGIYDLGSRKSFKTEIDEDYDCSYGCDGLNAETPRGDEEIDSKAEEFISKFYEQMKLQRQILLFTVQEDAKQRHELTSIVQDFIP